MAAKLRIEVLGRCEARIGERRIDSTAQMVFAALLLLGLEPGRRFSRQQLTDVLWPDVGDSIRAARLRWLLAKLRAMDLPIGANARAVELPATIVELDVDRVEDTDPSSVGDILSGYAPRISPAFMDWLERQRELLRTRAVEGLTARLTVTTEQRDWPRAAALARAILRLDPPNHAATLTLADAEARRGSKESAAETLERYLTHLGEGASASQLSARVLLQRILSAANPIGREVAFVGREEQLGRIDAFLTETRQGCGGALVLVGPAGIGKTRLLEEARLHASLLMIRVVSVRCQRGDIGRPLAEFDELTEKLLNMRGAAGCAPEHLELLARLMSPAAQNTNNGESHKLAARMRSRIQSAFVDLLDAVAAEGPLLIQIDDAQWTHPSAHWLWKALLDWSATHPVAVLLGLRPTKRPAMLADVATLSVGALEHEAAGHLLDQLVSRGPRAMSIADREALLARGAGSPLFLTELVRHWEAGARGIDLPRSLYSVLDGGLTNLSGSSLRVLQVAGLLGRYATLDRIEQVTQLPRDAFVEAMLELDGSGILTIDASGLACGHVLWAEAAIARLSNGVRRLFHRYAAERLSGDLASNPSLALLWETAGHWEQAGDVARASTILEQGSEHLARNGFPDEAAAGYERMIKSATDAREQLRLRRRRVELLIVAARCGEAIAEIDRHESLAAEVNPLHEVHNELELTRHWALYQSDQDSAACMQRAYGCAMADRASVSHRLRAAKLCAQVANLCSLDMLKKATRVALAIAPQTADEEWDWSITLIVYGLRLGDIREATRLSEGLVRGHRQNGPCSKLGFALEYLAISYWLAGRLTDALAALAEGIEVHSRLGDALSCAAFHGRRIELSIDVMPESVTREYLAQGRRAAALANERGSPGVVAAFDNYEAELDIRNGRPGDGLRRLPSVDQCAAFNAPTWRLRPLAMHLLARTTLGETERTEEIARAISACFEGPDYWHDWPAQVYAEYLVQHNRHREATSFARRYLTECRREQFPPPRILTELVGAHDVQMRPSSTASAAL